MIIFSYVPPRELLTSCPAVCRAWRLAAKGMLSVGPFVGPNCFRDALNFWMCWSKVYKMCTRPVDFARGAEAASLASSVCRRAFAVFFPEEFSAIETLVLRKSVCMLPLCTNLAHLRIDEHVAVDDASCQILSRTSTLRTLQIRENPIVSLRCFCGNTGLEHLEITSCPNVGNISWLGTFERLVSFRYSPPRGSEPLVVLPYDFSGLPSLELFELRGCQSLEDWHLDGLYDSTNLEVVDISYNFALTSAALRFLHFTCHLRILNISHTAVTSIVPVAGCAFLEELIADDTYLHSPVPATYCKRLRVLSLRQCHHLNESLLFYFVGNCPLVKIKI